MRVNRDKDVFDNVKMVKLINGENTYVIEETQNGGLFITKETTSPKGHLETIPYSEESIEIL